MDFKTAIRLQNEKAKKYCSECGGNRRIRIAFTGSDIHDFITCPACKGRGEMQKLKSTDYEKATQLWRNEFDNKT